MVILGYPVCCYIFLNVLTAFIPLQYCEEAVCFTTTNVLAAVWMCYPVMPLSGTQDHITLIARYELCSYPIVNIPKARAGDRPGYWRLLLRVSSRSCFEKHVFPYEVALSSFAYCMLEVLWSLQISLVILFGPIIIISFSVYMSANQYLHTYIKIFYTLTLWHGNRCVLIINVIACAQMQIVAHFISRALRCTL